jgi:hypothetical protein
MKIDKKKIVFASIIVIVLIFIVSYTMLVFMEEEAPAGLEQTLVPELKEEQKEYTSKIDALNDLKEERERTIPSVYSDHLLDSLDAYAPAIEEREREWVVDSIYRYGNIDYEQGAFRYQESEDSKDENEIEEVPSPFVLAEKDLSAGHATFFISGVSSEANENRNIAYEFPAEINGSQTVRTGDRLELILTEDAKLKGEIFLKNTLVYGFVDLQHNRLNIKITHIRGKKVQLKAFDLQDSNEGIYVENSLREEAGREVLDDLVQDINIAGLPQVGGVKNIFRKNNKRVKVTVLDQYQLILKAEK